VDTVLGIVTNSRLVQLDPRPTAGDLREFRVTSIAVQEARSPESGELDLSPYEGAVLLVHGQQDGGWVYSAEVVDQAGPILTTVVLQIFGQNRRANE
jgi:hypothetical protein